jgi:nucleotide-binding universal stress UspA family protein
MSTSAGHIVCATDLITTPRAVLETATTLAKSTGATLTLLHVLKPPVFGPGQDLDAPTMARLQTEIRAKAIKTLQKLSARTSRAGVCTSLLLRDGDPAEQILRASRATKAKFIVMGTHGRRGLKRLFLGSAAQHVVSLAPCAVVTVRGK